MSEAKLSVIMPVFNAENRLELSINSVLNQTYRNIELILIDDGSTDSSPMICDQYAQSDSRVTVIHQVNARVSAARNQGIQIAVGQYLSFIDADDVIDLEAYEVVIREMCKKSLDMIIFGMSFEYYKKKKLCKVEIKTIDEKICFEVKNIKECFFYLAEHNYFLSTCNKMIKASIIKKNLIFFENEMSILEDYKFVLDVLEKSEKVCAIPAVWYHYFHNLQSSQLKRRPSINYVRNFMILDMRIRDFARRYELDQEADFGVINAMILRYYIIAIEKIFSSNDQLEEKYSAMKEIIRLEEFSEALKNASVTGKRLTFVCCLLERKRLKMLFFLFFSNDYLYRIRKKIKG
jgi:glycosyltransferase involved in cell wall biosynthesis